MKNLLENEGIYSQGEILKREILEKLSFDGKIKNCEFPCRVQSVI